MAWLIELIRQLFQKPATLPPPMPPVVVVPPPKLREVKPMLVSRKEILMGRDVDYPLTPALERNLERLLVAINQFRDIYDQPMYVSSGYRPGIYNTKAGGAPNSAHLTCEAVDFLDRDGKLAQFCLRHQGDLEEIGLWMESPEHTVGWVHLQTRPARNRVFIP